MESTSILVRSKLMIEHAKNINAIPVLLIMNPATQKKATDEAYAKSAGSISPMQKILFKMRSKDLALQNLNGVPIVPNSHYPDGMVSLHLASATIGGLHSFDPSSPHEQNLSHIANMTERQSMDQSEAVVSNGAAAPAPSEDRAPTLDDLSSSIGNGPSASDVLIKSMEDLDSVKYVLVLRVFKNDNVDLGMNCEPITAPGILQKAAMYLAQKGIY